MYTIDQMAEILGISQTLAYQLVRNGTMPTIMLGKRKRITINNLIDYIGDSSTVYELINEYNAKERFGAENKMMDNTNIKTK